MDQPKIRKTSRIINLIILGIALAAGTYTVILSNNTEEQWEEYQREKYANYVAVEGRITHVRVKQDNDRHFNTYISVEFSNQEGKVNNAEFIDNKATGIEEDQDITVYYDPGDPSKVISERIYSEAMKPPKFWKDIP